VFEYVSLLGTLSSEKAVSRKVFDYSLEERNNYLSTMFWFYLALIMLIVILFLVFSQYISNWISPNTMELYVVVVIAGVISVIVKFFTLILVNEEKSNEILTSSLASTVVTHSSPIALILTMKLGVISRFIGLALGLITQLYILSIYSKRAKVFQIRLCFDFSMVKDTLILATPVMASTIMVLLFSYADRLFLKEYSGDASVGLYGLALIIGKAISLIFEALATALFPVAINALNGDYKKGIRELESLSNKYYLLLLASFAVIYLMSPTIISMLATEAYSSSSSV
jgi:O-antigen/teichoic acid export membrane protein